MTHSYVIIEDDLKAIKTLSLLMETHTQFNCIGTANDVTSAHDLIVELKPDFIFLDIEIPGGDNKDGGLTLIDTLQAETNLKLHIIVVSGFEKYGVRSTNDDDFIHYLLKPIDEQELKTALSKLYSYLPTPALRLEIRNKNVIIPYNELLYIESNDHQSKIFKVNGERINYNKGLKVVEEMLHPTNIVRVHNRYIINLNKIDRNITINKNCTLISGKVIPIGGAYETNVFLQINSLK